MNNANTNQIRAKGRLRLIETTLFFVLVIGGLLEYQAFVKPLDSVVLIYQKQTGATEENKEETVPAEPQAEVPTPKANPNALNEFLGYLKAVQQDVASIEKTNPVLDNIVQAKPQELKPQNKDDIKDNQIVVYDDNNKINKIISSSGEVVKEEAIKQINDSQITPEEKAKEAVEEIITETEVKEELAELAKEEEKQVQAVQNDVEERIKEDIKQVEEDGEETPIVLIPGLVKPQPDEEKANNQEPNADNQL